MSATQPDLYEVARFYRPMAWLVLLQFLAVFLPFLLMGVHFLRPLDELNMYLTIALQFRWYSMLATVIVLPVLAFRTLSALGMQQKWLRTLLMIVPVVSFFALMSLGSRVKDATVAAGAESGFFGPRLPFDDTRCRPNLFGYAFLFILISTTSGLLYVAHGEPDKTAMLIVGLLLPAVATSLLVYRYPRSLSVAEITRLSAYCTGEDVLHLLFNTWRRARFIRDYGSAEVVETIIVANLQSIAVTMAVCLVVFQLATTMGTKQAG